MFPTNSIARKLETFWPTHLHSAVHAAVSGRCVLPAVRPVQEAPVAVVPKVALVRPPLIKISYYYYYYWVIHLWAISSISSSHTISIMLAASGCPGSSPFAILDRRPVFHPD